MKAIVDADSITYSAACSVERRYYLSHHDGEEYQYKKDVPHIEEGFELCYEVGELWMAKSNADNLLKKILENTECDDFEVYLTGHTNFRFEIDSDYKANREDLRRPEHLLLLRKHLVDCWGAEIVEGMEADDKCSIEAWKVRYSELPQSNPKYIVCHIDKDLDQIPGLHYNWIRDEVYRITELEAAYNYWIQVLTGDVSDNIKGIRGIGPAKASKILEGSTTIQDMEDKVKEAYLLDGRKRKISDKITLDRMEQNKKLLYLLKVDPATREEPHDNH